MYNVYTLLKYRFTYILFTNKINYEKNYFSDGCVFCHSISF